MKARATIRLRIPSKKKFQAILKSLEPETNGSMNTRSRAQLSEEEGFLILNIEAKDTVALRAALNAYLRWIGAILNVFQTLVIQEI